jgi:hypothetical protein
LDQLEQDIFKLVVTRLGSSQYLKDLGYTMRLPEVMNAV